MSKLKWDETGYHFYETGVKKGVLYPQVEGEYPLGVNWDGLTGVTESPSGAESSPQYADNIKYLNLRSAEEYGGTIEAFQSPEEFDYCDGTASPTTGVKFGQQSRQAFGFSWVTQIGNDTDGDDHGYKIHLVWGATAAPSERSYTTINDSPEAMTLSWTFDTVPVNVSTTGFKPTASATIISTDLTSAQLKAVKNALYGTESTDPYLPLPDELIALLNESAPTYTYTAVTPTGTENPSTEGWYERSGSAGSYVYALTTDTTVDNTKTYYSRSTS